MLSDKTILIVDDNLINRKILIKILSGEYRVLEPGLLRASLGAAFYKDDGSGRAEALNEMLHELVADGTVAAILESYGVDAQAALAGLIHGQ